MTRSLLLVLLGLALSAPFLVAQETDAPASEAAAADPWLDLRGTSGPGLGRHIVFVTGDEEYRSEEGMPQLARILAERHGFRCTVLFAIDPATGAIDPGVVNNIPGLEHLDGADLMVILTRFRDLPDEQMKHVVDYVEAGKPIVGLRTSTHAFQLQEHPTYRRYSWRNPEWQGGFGYQVLGETWVNHHGGHGSQSTRGIPVEGRADHPILRGIAAGDVWDPSDVYTVRLPLREGIEPLLLGQVLQGMQPDSPPAEPRTDPKTGEVTDKNDPMMPLAWTRLHETASGKKARVFTTTMGASQAFTQPGSRRLIVNACFWALGMEEAIRPDLDVALVGNYEPSRFGFGKHRVGVKPSDLAGK